MPYKIWVAIAPITIRQTYTKTGTTPPIAPFSLRSGITSLTSFNSTATDIDFIAGPSPLTASISITAQSSPTAKTVTMTLIVKNITDGTTLSTQGPTGFTTVNTGLTYQWLGDATKVYEVTASASNT
jgi:hypothetical protein